MAFGWFGKRNGPVWRPLSGCHCPAEARAVWQDFRLPARESQPVSAPPPFTPLLSEAVTGSRGQVTPFTRCRWRGH
jgi:hypothetical protein